MKSILALMVVAACGSSPSKANVDSSPGGNIDTMPVAMSITITGTATAHGLGAPTPVSGALITAYQASDDSMVTSAMTQSDGTYTLTVQTNGVPLDGYLKATFTNYVDTYLYPPAPLAANFAGASVDMATKSNFDLLSTLAQGNEMTGKGLIAVEVEDATGAFVAGVTVSSSPASTAYRYDGNNALPSSTASSTATDGVAYMFNAPVGAITVSATKTGSTFTTHGLKAWADSLTTTLITP